MSLTRQMAIANRYFPHIDGLRTFAVLSVFLYHLNVPLIVGGFLGVDVFFVISGFLITRILKAEAEEKRFAVGNFYARRVRRLFPALSVVMIFCLILGTLRYSPERLVELATSGISAILSVSNFYFYFNNDYFDAAAETQVFLHTWSLAVEEQFYLIWPIVVFFVIKYLPHSRQVYFVAALFIIGMIATYLGTVTNTSMAFYMMPFRISEFALGAILCWLPHTKISQTARELLVLAALSVMLLCFLIISGEYTFPGLWFLAPCVATSVLIHIGNESIISRALLENRVSTYIGRLSYSLYLFHWPVIIFFKNELSTSLFLEDQIAIFLTAMMLAMITYHLVELPLRRPATIWPSKRQVAINFVIGVVVLTVSFWWLIYQKGLPERMPAQIRSIVETADIEKSRRFDIHRMLCRERGWDKCEELDDTQFNVLILGDSHSSDALNALHSEWPRPHYILYSENGCPPMTISDFDLTVKKNAKHYSKCRNKTQLLADGTIVKMADMLVVSSRYSWYTPSMLNRFLDSLELPLDYLIVIFGQAPTYSKGLPEIIYQHGQLAGLKERAAGFLTEETWMFNDELEQVASSHKAIFIPKAGYFCEAQTNQCELFYGEENKLLTYDKNHMSYEAAIELGNRISATWPQLIKED